MHLPVIDSLRGYNLWVYRIVKRDGKNKVFWDKAKKVEKDDGPDELVFKKTGDNLAESMPNVKNSQIHTLHLFFWTYLKRKPVDAIQVLEKGDQDVEVLQIEEKEDEPDALTDSLSESAKLEYRNRRNKETVDFYEDEDKLPDGLKHGLTLLLALIGSYLVSSGQLGNAVDAATGAAAGAAPSIFLAKTKLKNSFNRG